ncbi:MAG: TldD/PmbA family protein [Clostridiaceae bacterium]|nr:TldD/PmbA family protein [Clostridiaceae bacterium]
MSNSRIIPDFFIDQLLRKSKKDGFIESEVYFGSNQSSQIQIHNHEVTTYESSDTSGISFRGRISEQMGYSFSESFSDKSADFLITKARENCIALEEKERETLFEGQKNYPEVNNFSQALADKPIHFFSQLGLELEELILSRDSRIVAVDHLYISRNSGTELIRNTLGLHCLSSYNLLNLYVDCRCVSGTQTKNGYYLWAGRDPNQFNISEIADNVVERSVQKLGATAISSGKYPIILDSRAAADLLDSFCGIFSAETVHKGFSLLFGKINEKISSEILNIRDDSVFSRSLYSSPFDSEGVAGQSKALIENGILKSFLHNRKTAAVDHVFSTGNGFRSGYKGSINVSPTNLYVTEGQKEKAEMMRSMYSGLLITDLSGLHAGTNSISGDFSLSCEGFWVKTGVIDRPVDQIVVSGNFYSLLQSVLDISKDLYLLPPHDNGSIGSPSLFVEGLTISGE